MVDTPMSRPAVDKNPTGDWRAVAETTASTSQVGPSSIHFRGPSVDINPYILGCTDCLICGKSFEQIQDEAVIDYLHRGEAVEQFQATCISGRKEILLFYAHPWGSVLGIRLWWESVFYLPWLPEGPTK